MEEGGEHAWTADVKAKELPRGTDKQLTASELTQGTELAGLVGMQIRRNPRLCRWGRGVNLFLLQGIHFFRTRRDLLR